MNSAEKVSLVQFFQVSSSESSNFSSSNLARDKSDLRESGPRGKWK